MNRRVFLECCAAAGIGSTVMPGLLWSQLANAESAAEITPDLIESAEKLANLEFTPEERELMARGLTQQVENYAKLREIPLENGTPPALRFDPVLSANERLATGANEAPDWESDFEAPNVPADLEDVAFWPVTQLAAAIRAQRIRSVDLTEMYLDRLKRFDPTLHCVVTLTEERALRRAREADREIAAGNYRGPLHGIPWGAKDLLAVKGYRTTWGAKPFEHQTIDDDAEVVRRLDAAGAVLVAKLSLGALAMGDRWFNERTRNPWNPERGSSGSSAGPASAVAAGLVGFAIGSETNGSIASPSTACGVTGLRPTFGRVSRAGAMALSWSLDKLGPMCRSVADCALVLEAIHGADERDPAAVDRPFRWNSPQDLSGIRIGYIESGFTADAPENTRASLDALRNLGVTPTPVELPDYPLDALFIILNVEAAAAFDELTRSNRDDELVSQSGFSWPNRFRQARLVPAVEYVQANRIRTKLMEDTARVFEDVDVILVPTFHKLYLGNLTGHPLVIIPNGFNERELPTSIALLGGLFADAEALAVAHRLQEATGHHLRTPALRV